MTSKYRDIAFTASVRRAQDQFGGRQLTGAVDPSTPEDRLTPAEAEFISARDGFYLASVGEDGWPYVQFRGGPPGFLKVLDPATLAYADFRGNRQYISMGNVDANDRVSLFFMDYAGQRRLKLYARAEVHAAADRPDLAESVADPEYPAHVERVIVLRVVAYDWNCPQHITPRYTVKEIRALEAGR